MANNPLSPDSILNHMAEALLLIRKATLISDISSSYEAIALFSHACMIAVGFSTSRVRGRTKERNRMRTACSTFIIKMELFIRIPLFPLRTFSIFHAIRS
ncbi:hypothetical protein DID88_010469 [Monilinia fructigena]|uniref:PI31 proteasome regulator N-terminal domain-containing protein n=1 Tax=Monilinia fructigena TaxID=38457 RepID=A0A395ILH6_9HELO|nr:hypothetical protein DID88_010469 [Monilinia fructigena]